MEKITLEDYLTSLELQIAIHHQTPEGIKDKEILEKGEIPLRFAVNPEK